MDSYLFVLYDKTLKNGVPPPRISLLIKFQDVFHKF